MSALSRAAIFGLSVLSALPSCHGCAKEKEEKATPIARAVSSLKFAMLEDGTLILDASVQAFEVTKDDALVRVGDLPAYEPFLATRDDPGADSAIFAPRTLHGTRSAVELRNGVTAFVYEGQTWQRRTIEAPPYRLTPRNAVVEAFELAPPVAPPKDITLPTDFIVHGWVRTEDGSHVAYGQPDRTSPLPLTAIVLPGQKVASVVPFEHDATGQWTCHPIPSADKKTYASCTVPDVGDFERRVYRLDGLKWARLVLPFRDPSSPPMTIASDGAVWTARSEPARLVRAKDGRTQEFALVLPPKIEQPTYPPFMITPSRSSDARVGFTSPITSEPSALANITALVARPSGRIFALVRERTTNASAVFRVDPKEEPTPPLKKIGSEADQLLEIADTARPSLRWVSHCPHVFVELSNAQAARAARDLRHKDGLIWTAVEGTLGKRHVFGILTIAARAGWTASFEESISGTIEQLTKNPAAPPPAWCSLPLLERIL